MANKFGLSREIPVEIALEVRRRSKFGCVICRKGVVVYEHIDPEFHEAHEHDPDNICCLCSACHDKVTRKQFSKELVRKKYQGIQKADTKDVSAPFDMLDFHDGKAELVVGGISADPGVTSIVKYHGREILSVSPSDGIEPGGINALFLDDAGKETLRIEKNVWKGALDAWDTEVVGQRIKVRKKKGKFSLTLRLKPPGKIIIEHLDIRINDAHILVSQITYALGRYKSAKEIFWFHAALPTMGAPLPNASAIECLAPWEIERRDQMWNGKGQRLEALDGQIVMQSGLGITNKPLGIVVASGVLKFGMGEFSTGGPIKIGKMRTAVFRQPEKLAKLIGTGSL